MHQRLYLGEGSRGSAFYQVTRHGKGSSGKSNQRGGVLIEFVSDSSHGFDHVRNIFLRSERPKPSEICSARKWRLCNRPSSWNDVDAKADGVDGDDNVGKENGSVNAVAPHRLQGDFCCDLWRGDGIQDRAGASQGSVLRK